METAFNVYEWKECPVDMLRDFALANVSGSHKTCETHEVPQVFKDYAASIIEGEQGYEVDHWMYWISELESVDTVASCDPNHDKEWQLKFPHTHQWDGRTMILYLQVPKVGGALVILDADMNETDRFETKVGWAAVMNDHAIHGVKAIRGGPNRVTMIAGAYPYPPGSPKCRCPDQHLIPRVTN